MAAVRRAAKILGKDDTLILSAESLFLREPSDIVELLSDLVPAAMLRDRHKALGRILARHKVPLHPKFTEIVEGYWTFCAKG